MITNWNVSRGQSLSEIASPMEAQTVMQRNAMARIIIHGYRIIMLSMLFALVANAVQVFRVDPIPVMTTSGTAPVGGFPALYAVAGAGIKIYTDIGTTVLATTYTDATGTAPCSTSSQVVLAGTNLCTSAADNQGNFGFWLTSGTYYYTITLPAGSPTYGPYPLSSATSAVSGIAAGSGINTTGSGTVTINNTAQATVINAMAPIAQGGCGLAGDGSTNDTTALSTCITAASAAGTKPVVISFPVGIYGICNLVIASTTSTLGHNVSLVGAGAGGDSYPAYQIDDGGPTTFKYLSSCPTSGTPFIVQIKGTAAWGMTGGGLSGIRFDGNNMVKSPLILGPYGPRAASYRDLRITNQTGPAILMQGSGSNNCPNAPRDDELVNILSNGIGPYHGVLELDNDPCSNRFVNVKGDYGSLAYGIVFNNADSNLLTNIEVIPDTGSTGTATVSGGTTLTTSTGDTFYPAMVGHQILLAPSGTWGYYTVTGYTSTNIVTISPSAGNGLWAWQFDYGLPVTSVVCVTSVCSITTAAAHGVTTSAQFGIWLKTACTTAVVFSGGWTCTGGSTNAIAGLSGNFIATSTGSQTATIAVAGVTDGTYYSSPLWWSGVHMGASGGGAFANIFSGLVEDGDGGITDANTIPGSNQVTGLEWIYVPYWGFSAAKPTSWFIGSSSNGTTYGTIPRIGIRYGYPAYGQTPPCTPWNNGGTEGQFAAVIDAISGIPGTVTTAFGGSTHALVYCNGTDWVVAGAGGAPWALNAGGTALAPTLPVNLHTCTIAAPPSSPNTGTACYFTDAATTSDCTIGLGTAKSLCIWNGSAWAKP